MEVPFDSTWIVLGDRATVERLLRDYGGFNTDGSRLYNATSLHLDRNPHLLITPQVVMHVPSSRLGKAVACWRHCIAPELARSYNVLFDTTPPKDRPPGWPTSAEMDASTREFHERFMRFEQKRRGGWEYRYGFTWAMTESGDALVCGDNSVSFVAFTNTSDRLRPEAVRDLVSDTEHVLDMLRDHAGLRPTDPLDWAAISPEQFEDLCYDVILRSGRFDERTIRKHGKTRSRDGG
jgi:hypothetical protein